MQHGIYYAYWEKEWKGDYVGYIRKVSKLGFDILEIAGGPLPEYSKSELQELKKCAEEYNIRLTVGYGPTPDHNISSSDSYIRSHALDFYKKLYEQMEVIGADIIGGALYSCWPIDYSADIDKKVDWDRAVKGMAILGKSASEYGIKVLGLECLNRFENHILNTAAEGVKFVKQVHQLENKATNVKVMLDTFHMNIEEKSIGDAIRTAGDLLGHFHTGECNRMVPGMGRMPWHEIRDALHAIQYDGTVVMEPFVMPGGQVGKDIRIWRPLLENCTEERLDSDAKKALAFQRYMLD